MSFPHQNEAIKHDLVEFKVQCLKVFCYNGNKSTILLFYWIFRTTPEVSSKLYFVEKKYVKSQRSSGFLITKELIFGFQILDLKDHFSASLTLSKWDLLYNTHMGGGGGGGEGRFYPPLYISHFKRYGFEIWYA